MLSLCSSFAVAGDTRQPWDMVNSFPDEIDIVAVMNDPASQLLSDPGQASRGFLGSIGMFGKTRRAWDSLAELFETDADGVIQRLLSGRVVLFADSIMDHADNHMMLINAADTNWVIMAELSGGEDAYAALRKSLKPVPRDLVEGVAVYGIEQGRYAMVMLNPKDGEAGRVLLSPKGGQDLLKRVLDSILNDQNDIAAAPAPRWESPSGWSVAARIRVDEWISRSIDQDMQSNTQWGSAKHLRVLAGSDESGVTFSFAMPFDADPILGRAPIGMLDAMDENVVIAMASSSIIRFNLDQDEGLSMFIKDNGSANESTVLEPNGSLFVIDRDDVANALSDDSMGMTVLSTYEQGAISAGSVDSMIEPLVFHQTAEFPGVNQSQMGSYQGLFPNAVRSHSVVDDDETSNVSWITSERSDSTELIFSLGSERTDTGDRVRSLQSIASSFDAVGGSAVKSAVLVRGFARIGEVLRAFNAVPWMVSNELSQEFGMMTWEATQEPGAIFATIQVQKNHESSVQITDPE